MCPYNPHHQPEWTETEVSNQYANASGLVTVTTPLRVIRDSHAQFQPVLNSTDLVVAQVRQASGSKVDVLFLDMVSGTTTGAERVAQSASISGGKIVVYARGDN